MHNTHSEWAAAESGKPSQATRTLSRGSWPGMPAHRRRVSSSASAANELWKARRAGAREGLRTQTRPLPRRRLVAPVRARPVVFAPVWVGQRAERRRGRRRGAVRSCRAWRARRVLRAQCLENCRAAMQSDARALPAMLVPDPPTAALWQPQPPLLAHCIPLRAYLARATALGL